jgi:hypothetical protein
VTTQICLKLVGRQNHNGVSLLVPGGHKGIGADCRRIERRRKKKLP